MGSQQTASATQPRLTKAQRTAQRREKARLLREQEAKRRKRNRILIIVAAVFGIALLAFVVFKIATVSKEVASVKNVNADYGVFVTPEGAASAQAREGIPVVTIYEDPTCPHCVDLHAAMVEALDEHVKAGEIQLEVRSAGIGPIGAEFLDQSTQGAMSMFYVATHAPEKYLAFHDALMHEETGLYAAVSAFANGEGKLPDAEFMAETARKVGVSDSLARRMATTLKNPQWENYNQKTLNAFGTVMDGHVATPTVLLNGREVKRSEYGWPEGSAKPNSAEIAAWLDKVASGDEQ